MNRAIVTSCEHRPNILDMNIIGHVGWGFEYPDGSWCVGSVEGPEWRKSNWNGFWAIRVPNFQAALRYYAGMAAKGAEYDCYKLFSVPEPRWQQADQAVAYVARLKYEVFGRNCVDSCYDVLRAFGGGFYQGGVLHTPQQHPVPNDWFNRFEYEEYRYLPPPTSRVEEAAVAEYRALAEVEVPFWRQADNADFIAPVIDVERYKEAVAVIPPLA